MSDLKTLLKNKLTKKQIEILPRSFDVVGDILIFQDFPKELKNKERIIAETILKHRKNIKVVTKKVQEHKGVFRTKKLRILAGKRRKTTIHVESGVKLKLNVETCYFSPRLSTERLRIADLVKKNESILVMFSGIAVYPLVISKNSIAKEVFGIEINPEAHVYAQENVQFNKIFNIRLFKGDVKTITPNLKRKFDRIIMPLPKSADAFLPTALKASKKGTIIHFYDFLYESEIPHLALEKLKRYVKNFKVLNITRCGYYSPRKYQVCIDFRIL